MEHQRFEGERNTRCVSTLRVGQVARQALTRRSSFSSEVSGRYGIARGGWVRLIVTIRTNLRLSNLPIVIEMVEDSEHIERIPSKLDEMVAAA